MKELHRLVLEKHQKKHPGCALNEKRCKYSLTKDCIDKGVISEFMKNRSMCKPCETERQKKYYEEVAAEKRAAIRALRKKKKARSVSFKKGTRK
jgi:hypothetical protein